MAFKLLAAFDNLLHERGDVGVLFIPYSKFLECRIKLLIPMEYLTHPVRILVEAVEGDVPHHFCHQHVEDDECQTEAQQIEPEGRTTCGEEVFQIIFHKFGMF